MSRNEISGTDRDATSRVLSLPVTTNDPFDTARLRSAVLDAWAASPARFREDANAEEDLARGGYRDRLITELAQNAADAAGRAGVPGRLHLRLGDGRLTAANTGAPLDARGVESLSTLRASAKRDADTVGRFGVGFAATLTVSDTPAVLSRTGGVRWSLAEATALARGTAAGNPGLAGELDRRAGGRHAVPLLRLPLPAVDDPGTELPDGYDTAVVLPLRDAAAEDLAARLLDGVDDTLLLALPGLSGITVQTPSGTRTLDRRQEGPCTVITEGDRVTRWRIATDSGTAGPELLTDRPLEERERPTWSVTWAVPVGPGGAPAPPPSARVVHAPTPTDDPLALPALLLATFPLEPTRRHVAPGPLTDFLLEKAADAYAALLADWRPVTAGTLDLVPGPLGQGELDGALRLLLLDRLPRVPFLPPALPPDGDQAPPAAPEPSSAGDFAAGDLTAGERADAGRPVALRPRDAELAEDAGADTARVLADLFPALLPAGLERHTALRVLGVTRVPLGEMIDRTAGAQRPPAWWRTLYASLAGVAPGLLSGLPVPLEDGRTTIGPRQVLLPEASTDAAHLTRLGLKVAHPEAVHPLLEKLGAQPATPRAVLDTPQVRTAVAASLDGLDWDEDSLTPEELADTVLTLVRTAGLQPGDEPWLAALALPDEDGEPAPAGELVLPGSPFQQVIREGELAAVSPELTDRWGEQPLTAVGVQAHFALVRAEDVVLDPDELEPGGSDFAEPDDLGLLDSVDVWCEDSLDALPETPLPPVATEVLAVRDLELVDDDRWPQALALLAEPPLREALTTPVRVRMPDGGVETVRSYTAWWLRGAPVLAGRRPAGLRAAAGDPLLAGLYEAVDTADADEEVLRALGVRTTAAALLAEPGGAAELLGRLADPGLTVTSDRLHGLHTLLADLPPEDVTLPEELRAVRDGAPCVVPAAEAVVADAPDLLPLAAGRPLLPVAPDRAAELAAVLDVPLLSAVVPGVPPGGGVHREVPRAARELLGPDTPEGYLEHEELIVEGVDLDWRLTGGTLHAATVEGVAAGLAWATGQWPRRFELAALLEDPTRTAELETARWFD
ncbi:molecular chaperone Hsp90 [Streptomyces sp. ACA25]|uniref:sacsin N-terminal ATP-binding-like domain-containing protein n=1 Tax=Streptomyces sp. ACA25 TaxID=3022596 RepID=UPI0023073DF5|nr:molecular chaperone Hsp90 [Streptomyces sp. ACA25]MDB1088137.1 molecular chaperone Hsp90 [Streptomyces sp. ACA25]